jgi:hypothetical protein
MLIDISKEPGVTTLINIDHVVKVTFENRMKNTKRIIVASFHMSDDSIESFDNVDSNDIKTKLMTIITAPPGYKLITINETFENSNNHDDIFMYDDIVAFAVHNEDYGLRPLTIDDFSNDKDDDKIILTPDKRVVAQGRYSHPDFDDWKKHVIEAILAKRDGTKTYSDLFD